MSARAWTLILYFEPAASQMFSAAPLPRPPQPMRPTLLVSAPAAWTVGARPRPRPVAAAPDTLRKSRREAEIGPVMVCRPLRFGRKDGGTKSGAMGFNQRVAPRLTTGDLNLASSSLLSRGRTTR